MCHVLTKFGDAPIEWSGDTDLDTPVVPANIRVTDDIVTHIKRGHVQSGPITRNPFTEILPAGSSVVVDLNLLVRIISRSSGTGASNVADLSSLSIRKKSAY